MFCQFKVDTTQVGINDDTLNYSKSTNSFYVQKNNSDTIYYVYVKSMSVLDTLKQYHRISDTKWERFDIENNIIETGGFKDRKMKKRHYTHKLFVNCTILKQTGNWTYLDKKDNKTYVVKYR